MIDRLFAQVPIASLVCFRIAFGGLMVWEMWSFLALGWVKQLWIEPAFHFSYEGLGWLRPWPGNGMLYHFCVLQVAACGILLGCFYRISAATFALGFSYAFLLDKTAYQNHLYLICLISFLMIFVPAHRALSIDALWRRSVRSTTVPAWALWIIRFQIAMPYFYGGLAKLNPDWLAGAPMRIFLNKVFLSRKESPTLLGRDIGEDEIAHLVHLLTYGGVLFDLGIVPLLLWRKTRVLALLVAISFHLTNVHVFNIGVFPWLMIPATTIFLSPDWPLRVWRFLRRGSAQAATVASEAVIGGGADVARRSYRWAQPSRRLITILLIAYLTIQLLVPFRRFLYPGRTGWTKQGHRFSWRMLLDAYEGRARIDATRLRDGKTWEIDPAEYATLSQQQRMQFPPDMILAFCRHVAEKLRQEHGGQIEVRATVAVSLNGRRLQLLIDPEADLAAQRSTLCASWIKPLTTPLSQRFTSEDYEKYFGPSAVKMNRDGAMLAVRGYLDRAIKKFYRALEINPDYTAARVNLGEALVRQGQLDLASHHLRQALRVRPDNVTAHHGLGVIAAKRGDVDRALEHFQTVLRWEPDSAAAHHQLGLALERKGQLDDAAGHYRAALRINSAYLNVHVALVRVLRGLGAHDEANKHEKKARKLRAQKLKRASPSVPPS